MTAHAFAGAINEFDTKTGVSTGSLWEAGGGGGTVGGVGKIISINGEGQLGSEGLVYMGAGGHTPVVSASAGVVGFTSGIGVYGEGFLFGRGGGGGVYLNITTNAECNQK